MSATFIPNFEPVTRVACKASIMIEGLQGHGKSGLALLIAYALADYKWEAVYNIDTENKSINLFADIDSSIGGTFGKFNVGQLTSDIGYAPTNYLAYRNAAKKAGAKVVIKDSISHAWQYKGGVLDLVTQAKAKDKRFQKDSYAAWSDEDVMREKLELLSLIRDEDVHVITTVRVKEKMEYGTDDQGKTKLISLGEQQIQQGDLKYEPDLVLQMIKPGANINGKIQHPVARVTKTRYAILQLDEVYEFTPELLEQIRQYLAEGVDPKILLEKQRQDYMQALKAYLDSHKGIIPVWKALKADAGYADTKLEDIPLDAVKQLYMKITE